MANMASNNVANKEIKTPGAFPHPVQSLDQMHSASRHSVMMDEDSDEEDDYHIPELEPEEVNNILLSPYNWSPFFL